MSVTEIARRLKKARLDAGFKQKEVADMLGITYQAISNYERGTNRVDTDTLTKLCNIYGIKISDLLRTPAWTDEMKDTYLNATSTAEQQACIRRWGTPSFLLEEQNNLREPDPSPLSPEDEALLYAYHHATPEDKAILDNIVSRYTQMPSYISRATKNSAIKLNDSEIAEIECTLFNFNDK